MIKLKQIQKLDKKIAKIISHAIHPTLTIDNHTANFVLLFISKLRNHLIIFDQPLIKKNKINIDMTNDFLTFWSGHYIYVRATCLLNSFSLSIKTTVVKIKKNIISQKIWKKNSKKDITNFLLTLIKLFCKKKNQINKNKQKTSIKETS